MEEEKSDNRSLLPPGGSAPWLVYTHGNAKSKTFQTFCSISSSPPYTRHYFKSIPQLRGKFIFFSNDGWLLLRDHDNLKVFTLWNPISLQLINLPPLNALDDRVWSNALVCPPSEDGNAEDVTVLVFVDGTAFSYRPCRDNYTWIARSTEVEGQRAVVRSAVICNDIIYGYVDVQDDAEIGLSEYFVIIEVSSDDAHITLRSLESEIPEPDFRYIYVSNRLLVSCGQVYCIGLYLRDYADKRISAVNIWEFDSCLAKWVQVKDLMGRAFFLGQKCCTWCWGTTPGNESEGVMQNSVYFEVSGVKNLGVEEALYLYNLDDCSLKSLLPCPKLPSSWYTPCWVMSQYPTNPRLARDEEAHEQCIQKIGSLELDNLCVDNRSDISESSSQFSFLCDLPLHIIEFVAQKMHLFDYLNFRATCKEFRSIAPPMTRWRTKNQYPLLLLFENEEEPFCSFMDPCRTDLCHMTMPSELFHGVVHLDVSKDGWLLLRTNEGTSLHFFNPFSRVSRELTPFELIPSFSVVGFSSCPTSPDCVTVGMSCCGEVVISYHCFEEDTWNVCAFDWEGGIKFHCVLNSPVYHKGAFYFLDIKGYLGVFELVDEEWNVYDKPQTPGGDDDSFHSRHLVECDGELLSVFIGEMGSWVRVFRFNRRKKKWFGVKSIGNYVLFVGPWSSFSMVAKEPEMGNRIYLPRRCGNEILFYDLNTHKYGTLTGEDKDFTDTREHLRCTWI